MLRAHLRLDGIRCERCARSVVETLGSVRGIARTEVSLSDRSAEVEYDEARIDEQEIVRMLWEDGYDATPAPSAGP